MRKVYIRTCTSVQSVHFCILAGSVPPGVMLNTTGCNFATLSLTKPGRLCDGMISGYNVRYQLSSSTGSDYTTVNATGDTVTLQGLTPNAEYTVQVAVITSVGSIGAFSSGTTLHITGK